MDAEEASLDRLFGLGRARAGGSLAAYAGDIGVRSSLDAVARLLEPPTGSVISEPLAFTRGGVEAAAQGSSVQATRHRGRAGGRG